MKNIQETLMSQYANSPVICSLITGLNDCIDPSKNINTFYSMAFNVRTAKGFGLDIWGRIVGVSRNVEIPVQADDRETFGFNTSPPSYLPFNNAPFGYDKTNNYGAFQLLDEQYRTIILLKAASNILLATAPNINKFMKMIFGNKRAYYSIIGHMKARYVFEFNLSSFERNIVHKLNLLPRPSGVLLSYFEIATEEIFGFLGSEFQPFNQGVFYYE